MEAIVTVLMNNASADRNIRFFFLIIIFLSFHCINITVLFIRKSAEQLLSNAYLLYNKLLYKANFVRIEKGKYL